MYNGLCKAFFMCKQNTNRIVKKTLYNIFNVPRIDI